MTALGSFATSQSLAVATSRSAFGRRTAQRVACQILRDIRQRELRVGDRLPQETEMQEEYGVSRATLREALHILETFGILAVKTGPGGGPYVRKVGVAEFSQAMAIYFEHVGVSFDEIASAYVEMWPFLARTAAGDLQPEARERLRCAMASAAGLLVAPGQAFRDAVVEFHMVVATATSSRVLNMYAMSLGGIRESCNVGTSHLRNSAYRKKILSEHHAIGQAILDGDSERAETLARLHMAEGSDRLFDERRSLRAQSVEWS